MPYDSEEQFLVAHSLRIKGFATAEGVSAVAGIEESVAVVHLGTLRDAGHALHREGRITGWSLTPGGRTHHTEVLAAATDTDRADAAYRKFLALNEPFLAVCTDWQLRDGVLNDHGDASYDEDVIDRLRAIDADVQVILADLCGHTTRFRTYGPRLADARSRVETGERDWFTGAMIESYHTVWFELHEDLLATLGIERAKERS